MDEDFSLRLTDIGREVAEQTYEKHCFFTRRLIAAGVDPQTCLLYTSPDRGTGGLPDGAHHQPEVV